MFTLIFLLMVAGLTIAAFLSYCNSHPGCLRSLFSEATLETIDARIELAEMDGEKASLLDVVVPPSVDLPAKHSLEPGEQGGDGKVWVLGDDGEIVELDQLKE